MTGIVRIYFGTILYTSLYPSDLVCIILYHFQEWLQQYLWPFVGEVLEQMQKKWMYRL